MRSARPMTAVTAAAVTLLSVIGLVLDGPAADALFLVGVSP
jgi:hypothetical protein